MVNSVIRLRRDNDYNYKKVENTFIPAAGEVCLIDTARDGLRAVVGDGFSTFGQLKFVGDLVVRGYVKDELFYEDSLYTVLIEGSTTKLYIDLSTSLIYQYNGTNFAKLGQNIPTATAAVAGVMKLYDTIGQNTDGTMTQKAISDELDDKIEVEVLADQETVVFTTN